MRKFGLTIFALTASLLLVTAGNTQPPPRGPGGFGSPGQDAVGLVRNPAVAKELDITEEQLQKLPEALSKALGEVLSPEQMKRLRQIELQQRGAQALADAKVQSSLKFSDEQKTNVKTILEDSRKEMAEIAKDFRGGNFQEAAKKMQAVRSETQEKVQGVLTSDQKKQWKDMVGEEFKMPAFGGFPGAGGTPDGKKRFEFKKKTDDKK